MASLSSYTLLMLYCTFCSISIGSSDGKFSKDLFEVIEQKRTEKTSHLHFYFQDIHSGRNPTAMQIIAGDKTGFGMTFMMDNPLTEAPERDSKILGRAQGMYSLASQNDVALLMVATYLFTEGQYNGSSVSILGRNHVMDNEREMPIVGGTGLFRFARGYALAHTIALDATTGDASVEYNVYVQHFEN